MQSIAASRVEEILVKVGDAEVRLTYADAKQLVSMIQKAMDQFTLAEVKSKGTEGCDGLCGCAGCPDYAKVANEDIPF